MGSWPDPTPFEREDGSISSSLDALLSGPGTALAGVLLVGERTGERAAWSRAAAVRLAQAWVRTGRRVILVDLEVSAPTLHEALGVSNEQGVTDHFAFGTSLELLAVPVEEGAWSLVPAGPWGGDAAELLTSPEWGRLLRSCGSQDATLLAYVPADAPGLAELARVFGAVVVLGAVPELPEVSPFSVVAVLEHGAAPGTEDIPRQVAPPQPETPDEAFERIRLPTDPRTREQLIADLRFRQRAALMAPPAAEYRPSLSDLDVQEPLPGVTEAAGVLSPEAAAVTPPVPATPLPATAPQPEPRVALLREPPPTARIVLPPPRRSRAPIWWTVAVLALLSLLAGSWHFMQTRLRAREASEEAARSLEVPMRLPEPMPAEPLADTVLAYVVAMEEHVRLPSALERVNTLRAALPQTGHFVVPVVRDDALYYRVASGPLADAADAAALLDTLLLRRQVSAVSEGEVQQAPLAFLLGDYPSRDSADARVNGLRRLEIPSYVIPLAGPPERYRVYAGGYSRPAEAQVMREILQSVGEADVLVDRVGKR